VFAISKDEQSATATITYTVVAPQTITFTSSPPSPSVYGGS
jgi:hypothetical protein